MPRLPARVGRPGIRQGGKRQQAAGAEHPVSPGDGLPGIIEEMEREASGHDIEVRVPDLEPVSVHDTRGKLRNVAMVPG